MTETTTDLLVKPVTLLLLTVPTLDPSWTSGGTRGDHWESGINLLGSGGPTSFVLFRVTGTVGGSRCGGVLGKTGLGLRT